MGQRVIAENAGVDSVVYKLPNKHYIPVNMNYIGVDNTLSIFFFVVLAVVGDAPQGQGCDDGSNLSVRLHGSCRGDPGQDNEGSFLLRSLLPDARRGNSIQVSTSPNYDDCTRLRLLIKFSR
jgi:hypothetical protein